MWLLIYKVRWSGICGQFRLWYFVFFFYNIIKVNHVLYRFSILLHLIPSLSLTKSLVVLYAYVSIESIDSILLSSFKLREVLFISSVKTLFLSLLNLCCIFNIDLYFFYNFFTIFSNTIQVSFFILNS